MQRIFYIVRRQISHDRRAIQTFLYEVLLSLTKLVSPILSHTADEVWAFIPGVSRRAFS